MSIIHGKYQKYYQEMKNMQPFVEMLRSVGSLVDLIPGEQMSEEEITVVIEEEEAKEEDDDDFDED